MKEEKMPAETHELVTELVQVVRELKEKQERIEHAVAELQERFADTLNEAYAQGVRDATKARTGRDPKVEKMNHDA
jgi:flagellar biosynthesis/type III secretory pathway protein FliH